MLDALKCGWQQVDLDLGNYERFLDISLTKKHNLTTGKVYQVTWHLKHILTSAASKLHYLHHVSCQAHSTTITTFGIVLLKGYSIDEGIAVHAYAKVLSVHESCSLLDTQCSRLSVQHSSSVACPRSM